MPIIFRIGRICGRRQDDICPYLSYVFCCRQRTPLLRVLDETWTICSRSGWGKRLKSGIIRREREDWIGQNEALRD